MVTRYKTCAAAATYPAGYSKGIVVDGYTAGKAPQVGQLLAFGTGAQPPDLHRDRVGRRRRDLHVYLDRPLEVAVTDDDRRSPAPTAR